MKVTVIIWCCIARMCSSLCWPYASGKSGAGRRGKSFIVILLPYVLQLYQKGQLSPKFFSPLDMTNKADLANYNYFARKSLELIFRHLQFENINSTVFWSFYITPFLIFGSCSTTCCRYGWFSWNHQWCGLHYGWRGQEEGRPISASTR